jgi:hypothetical protein
MLELTLLEDIKHRYFRPTIARKEGYLTHFADCDVYRSVSVYGSAPCTCGFNHDLREVGIGIAVKLNPKYFEELAKQYHPPQEQLAKEEVEQLKIDIAKAFGCTPEDLEPSAEDEAADWELIARVFGEDYVTFLKERSS